MARFGESDFERRLRDGGLIGGIVGRAPPPMPIPIVTNKTGQPIGVAACVVMIPGEIMVALEALMRKVIREEFAARDAVLPEVWFEAGTDNPAQSALRPALRGSQGEDLANGGLESEPVSMEIGDPPGRDSNGDA